MSDTGHLLGFEIQHNGDVILCVSDIEDRYGHYVTVKAQELAGIAEASAVSRETWRQAIAQFSYSYNRQETGQ